MITLQDKELLAKKGISEEQIAEQLACFEKGFPYLKLSAAASVEQGILAPDADEQKKYLNAWETYTQTDKTVVKFVPASGAASRMFKNLFEFLGAEYDAPQSSFEKTFFEKIEKFAFYDDLNAACQKTTGKDIPALLAAGNYKAVVAALLESAGLNYGALPKGLLKFHKYEDGSRTPLEEHLVCGQQEWQGECAFHRISRASCAVQGIGGRESGRLCQEIRCGLQYQLLRAEAEHRYHCRRYGKQTFPR